MDQQLTSLGIPHDPVIPISGAGHSLDWFGEFPKVRLPGLPWSPTFMAAYEAAMSGPRTIQRR
jgi:hypothetical protein